MQRDYTLSSLQSLPREELETLSLRMIHRLIDETSMTELFTFDAEQTTSAERQQEAQFDAMLRMSAIALSQLPALFSDSEHEAQNTQRMQRLLLWHFYAVSFHLEQAIPLERHCQHVDVLLMHPPANALEWVTTLTDLLRQYAQISTSAS
ncbi:exoribonuclease R [Vibrio ostreicida]|uniref:Exoribonuclease R n=1 Tax=Vibrio ostreicida TaxID=526588 RepID=A0ABT8BZ87_9VIBR|nr:exoribonuclease R [Vibrio ostreicida]MDN3611360.1 exoribonuclease R [Vibrio ostreicida]NPD09296.1 exoribonuclease R [Vibrio ostreicida]